MKPAKTKLVRGDSQAIVEAELLDRLTPDVLLEVEHSWGPIRRALAANGVRDGKKIPEHFHWDWGQKGAVLRLLAFRCLGVRCAGTMEGLIMLNMVSHVVKLEPDKGKDQVYVEFVETAPWNLRELVDTPRFKGVGSCLIRAAVKVSMEEGMGGRLALCSLPQSREFYEKICRMTSLGFDSEDKELEYFELTRENAALFLED